jgi:protein phosphatase
MGTTLTALIPEESGVTIGHVGDSRAYLLRDGELRQLTLDHSLVEELVREGRLTHEQAAVHPQRSIITRALGVEPNVEVDVYTLMLAPGDRLLLCSDGLTGMVQSTEIGAILRRESDPTRAANALVDAANAAGGEDNITTIIVDVEADTFDPLPSSVAAALTGTGAVARGGVWPAPTPEPSGASAGATQEGSSDGTGEATAVDGVSALGPLTPEPVPAGGTSSPGSPAFRTPISGAPGPGRAGSSSGAGGPELLIPVTTTRPERHIGRSIWRVARFAVPILVILGLAVGAIAWYARRTYYVGLTPNGRVAVYQGRPGGLLLWDPTLVQQTRLRSNDLTEDVQVQVEHNKEFSNRGDALAYVARARGAAKSTARTSTTTSTTTTTSVAPPVPPA